MVMDNLESIFMEDLNIVIVTSGGQFLRTDSYAYIYYKMSKSHLQTSRWFMTKEDYEDICKYGQQ